MNKKLKVALDIKSLNQLEEAIRKIKGMVWATPINDRFGQYLTVIVKHGDGSKIKLNHCFLRWAQIGDTKLILLFSEYCNEMWFFRKDLKTIKIVTYNNKNKLVFKNKEI